MKRYAVKRSAASATEAVMEHESPYLAARREWDERYGSVITRARNWRAAAYIALFVAVLAVAGLIVISMRSRVVPYIVAVDSMGRVVSQGPAAEASVADDRLKRAALVDWVEQFRMVSSDAVVERAAIEKVYAMIANNSPAAVKVSEIYKSSSPLDRAQTGVVTVEIHTVYATSAQTYEVEWTETAMDLQGTVTATQNYKGAFSISVHPPQDEGLARVNPLGIYVTDVNVSKVL
jgi:type IV secretion system protein VirB5